VKDLGEKINDSMVKFCNLGISRISYLANVAKDMVWDIYVAHIHEVKNPVCFFKSQ
jgi:hypothetical protein